MSAVKLPPLTDGIVAARAVLGDFIEDATGVRDLSCAGGDPTLRRKLEDGLVAEVMQLAETHDERAAVRAEPWPGKWYGDGYGLHADGRDLTQHETDVLIANELWSHCVSWLTSTEAIIAVLGEPKLIEFVVSPPGGFIRVERATQQRGGIASDPLVRLIAWRAWGGRDISAYWGIDRSVHINRVEIRDPDRFIADLENSNLLRPTIDHAGRLRRG